MRVGMSEILVILLAALILFGPSRLPEMGKALGKAIREFRRATSDLGKELEEAREEINRETTAAPAPPTKPASADQAGQVKEEEPAADSTTVPKSSDAPPQAS